MNSLFKMWALWFNPVEWSTKDRTRDFSGSSILPYKIINGHAMPIILHNKFQDFLFGALSLWGKSCGFTDKCLTPWTSGMEFLDWKGLLCVRLLSRNYIGCGSIALGQILWWDVGLQAMWSLNTAFSGWFTWSYNSMNLGTGFFILI